MPTDVNIFLTILLLIVGGAILISGGEVFVRGAVRLATLFRISPLIIGLMIVAPATSAPELSVSLIGVFGKNPNPDIAIGNVVGSNIANIPLILGLSSLIRPLVVSSSIIKREIPMMIVASFLLWGIGFFTVKTGPAAETLHRLPLWGGILFLALWVFHNVLIVKEAKRERNKEIADQIVEETQARGIRPTGLSGFLATPLLLGIGLSMLVFGSDLFVAEAKIIAEYCGVSELIVSLTILAVGTSLPELTVGLIAVLRGNVDIAVGNVVGSNIFNLLAILGVTAVAAGGLIISDQALMYDIPIMCVTALVGGYFCVTGRTLSRREGTILLLGYIGYIIFLVNRG
ncbi:MAG: calcium/sodium antiporter [Thermoguttaceae bacterium]|jgi:cation:H+ antiporter